MSLFNFGKKKESITPSCACNSGCPSSVANIDELKKDCCDTTNSKDTSIKVLGAGCSSCHTLLENTQKAVKNIGLDIEIEYVTDMQKVAQYGVMSIPALVVNEKVVTMGKVLKTDEVEKLLKKIGL